MKGAKTGGRQKGTPNKLTKELKAVLQGIVTSELERLPESLKKLDDKDRLQFLVKIIPYVLPKLQTEHYKYDRTISEEIGYFE